MKNRVRLRLAAFCIAFTLAACAGVTSNLAFKPPAGWSGTPSMFGRMQMWVKQGKDKRNDQFVMLIRGDVSSQNLFENAQFGRGSVTQVKRSTVMICGGRQAQYVTGLGAQGKNGRRTRLEALVADVGDSKYMAMYARDEAMPADPQAETAIHSLCPKG